MQKIQFFIILVKEKRFLPADPPLKFGIRDDAVMDMAVLVCVCSVALIGRFSETGMWIAFLLAEVITFIFIVAYIWFYRKRMPRPSS